MKKELQTSKDAESRAIGIISEIEKDMKSKDDEDISAKIAAMSADDIDKIIDETTSQDNDEKKADKKSSNENESNKRSKLRVCVCGGGHGGHAFVATIAGKLKPTFECNWFSMRGGGKILYTRIYYIHPITKKHVPVAGFLIIFFFLCGHFLALFYFLM